MLSKATGILRKGKFLRNKEHFFTVRQHSPCGQKVYFVLDFSKRSCKIHSAEHSFLVTSNQDTGIKESPTYTQVSIGIHLKYTPSNDRNPMQRSFQTIPVLNRFMSLFSCPTWMLVLQLLNQKRRETVLNFTKEGGNKFFHCHFISHY